MMIQFRTATAEIATAEDFYIRRVVCQDGTQRSVTSNAQVLVSCECVVALIDAGTMYLFPRWNRNEASMKDTRKFSCENLVSEIEKSEGFVIAIPGGFDEYHAS